MDVCVFPFIVWHILVLQGYLQGSTEWVYNVWNHIHICLQLQEFANCAFIGRVKTQRHCEFDQQNQVNKESQRVFSKFEVLAVVTEE
jgi:hypothetical protein